MTLRLSGEAGGDPGDSACTDPRRGSVRVSGEKITPKRVVIEEEPSPAALTAATPAANHATTILSRKCIADFIPLATKQRLREIIRRSTNPRKSLDYFQSKCSTLFDRCVDLGPASVPSGASREADPHQQSSQESEETEEFLAEIPLGIPSGDGRLDHQVCHNLIPSQPTLECKDLRIIKMIEGTVLIEKHLNQQHIRVSLCENIDTVISIVANLPARRTILPHFSGFFNGSNHRIKCLREGESAETFRSEIYPETIAVTSWRPRRRVESREAITHWAQWLLITGTNLAITIEFKGLLITGNIRASEKWIADPGGDILQMKMDTNHHITSPQRYQSNHAPSFSMAEKNKGVPINIAQWEGQKQGIPASGKAKGIMANICTDPTLPNSENCGVDGPSRRCPRKQLLQELDTEREKEATIANITKTDLNLAVLLRALQVQYTDKSLSVIGESWWHQWDILKNSLVENIPELEDIVHLVLPQVAFVQPLTMLQGPLRPGISDMVPALHGLRSWVPTNAIVKENGSVHKREKMNYVNARVPNAGERERVASLEAASHGAAGQLTGTHGAPRQKQ
jgi:hypothetical protein